MTEDSKVIELVFHGRGGQGAITAAELLCELAYEGGFEDVLSIPKIGAERRGAPIKAFVKLSHGQIKNLAAVFNSDIAIVFDTSLLPMPGVLDAVKKGILIVNASSPEEIDLASIPSDVKVYIVDATGISLGLGLKVSGSPILNVPVLGAYSKVTEHFKLEHLEKVLNVRFGSKADLNLQAAKKAFEQVTEVER